jgi:biotin operon repressor
MKLREILIQAVKEVAEETNISEEEIWKVVPKIKGKV